MPICCGKYVGKKEKFECYPEINSGTCVNCGCIFSVFNTKYHGSSSYGNDHVTYDYKVITCVEHSNKCYFIKSEEYLRTMLSLEKQLQITKDALDQLRTIPLQNYCVTKSSNDTIVSISRAL